MTYLARYTPEEPLVLFTEFPPEMAGGGCVNIKSLLTPEIRRRILWVTTAEGDDAPTGDAPTLRLRTASRGRLAMAANSSVRAPAIARELLDAIRAHRGRGLWIVAHGIAVPVGASVARAGAVPIHVSVNDDPVFATAMRAKQLLPLVPLIERSFADLLRRARSVEVVSENMRRRYQERYGVSSVISNRGVATAATAIAPYDKRRGLRVGVLGNQYTYAPLRNMARAVGAAARALGVDAEIVVLGGDGFGERLARETIPGVRVHAEGHVPEDRAIAMLRETFLLYLGYPFGRMDAVLRQTSFPIKLVTYLQVGRPILVHAAADSSTHELGEHAPFVLRWTSDDVAEGAAAIAAQFERWSDATMGRGAAEAIRRRYFDLDAHRGTTFGALDRLVSG